MGGFIHSLGRGLTWQLEAEDAEGQGRREGVELKALAQVLPINAIL